MLLRHIRNNLPMDWAAFRTMFMPSSSWIFPLHPRQITASRNLACLSQIGLAKPQFGQSTSNSKLSIFTWFPPSRFLLDKRPWSSRFGDSRLEHFLGGGHGVEDRNRCRGV
jgi:hypothetical protein